MLHLILIVLDARNAIVPFFIPLASCNANTSNYSHVAPYLDHLDEIKCFDVLSDASSIMWYQK